MAKENEKWDINWNAFFEDFLPVLTGKVKRIDTEAAHVNISCYRVGEQVRVDIKEKTDG